MKKFYRHGDLILRPITKLPEGLKEVENKGVFVLAEGETTGHKHLLTGDKMKILQDSNGKFYMQFGEPIKLTHEEHSTITILPGIYEIGNEREYDYALESIKKVLD